VKTEDAIPAGGGLFWRLDESGLNPAAGAAGSVPPLEDPRANRWWRCPGKSQNDIVLGMIGPSRLAEDWHAANLANNILGVFGMYGGSEPKWAKRTAWPITVTAGSDGGLGPGAWRIVG